MIDLPAGTHPTRRWVLPLSATVMVGFGVILYGFSVYTTETAAGAEFSTTALSLAYGGSIFVGGLLALPVGRFADGRGVRPIIAAGSVLGFVGLTVFSVADRPWQIVAAWWAFLGPAQAMIYYEPSYVAIDQWAPARDRARTLATITLVGGLAGIVFIPLAAGLVSIMGWRPAVFSLATLLLVVGGATAVLALPSRRAAHRSAGVAGSLPGNGEFLRDRRFVLYTIAFMLVFMATQGIIAHRVARFEETGFSLTTVASWAALASAMSLPGRWIAPRLAERFGATRVQAVTALIVASSVLLMLDGSTRWQMIAHFCLFGLAFGALMPLRAMAMSDWFSGPSYGRIMGAQWTVVVLLGATGPILVGALRDSTGAYQAPLAIVTGLYVVAATVIIASGRTHTA